MTTDVPSEEAGKHRCWRGLGGPASVAEGTYRRCATCGRWWRSVQTYRYWTESEWWPVRWWQWRRRRHIKLARRPDDTGDGGEPPP